MLGNEKLSQLIAEYLKQNPESSDGKSTTKKTENAP